MKDFEILKVEYNNSALGEPGAAIRYLVDGERGTAYCLCVTCKGEFKVSANNGEIRDSIPAKNLLSHLREPLSELSGEHLYEIHDILGEAGYPTRPPRTVTRIAQSIRNLMEHRNYFRSDTVRLRGIIAEYKKNEQKSNAARDEGLALINEVLDDAGYCGDGRESVTKGIKALTQIRSNLQSHIDGVKRALLCAGFDDTGDHISQIETLTGQRDMFKDGCTTTQGRYNAELDRLRELVRKQNNTIIELQGGDTVATRYLNVIERQRKQLSEQAIAKLRQCIPLLKPLVNMSKLEELFEDSPPNLVRCVDCTKLNWRSVIDGKGLCAIKQASKEIYQKRLFCEGFRGYHGVMGELRELQRITKK